MKRREFISLLGGAAAWPLAARAQQTAMPVVGFLHPARLDTMAHLAAAFRKGLGDRGFVEGHNVAVEYRFAENQLERLPSLVGELLRFPVAVIVGNSTSMRVAKSATSTVPIVFVSGYDPVKLGLVTSINRPGGNVTGVTMFASEFGSKRLGLMREVVPNSATIAFLMNPNTTDGDIELADIQTAAHALGQKILVVTAGSEKDFVSIFAQLVREGVGALVVAADPFFNSRRERLVELATQHAVPTIYEQREYAEAGGLMSYGTSITDAYRRLGDYAGRVLKGARPADLPVLQPTRFQLVINLKTAKALGLTIPATLLATADEVIE
jgi:putative ABC transport system substrate-binding protein